MSRNVYALEDTAYLEEESRLVRSIASGTKW